MTRPNPTSVFPGDATPSEIRAAVEELAAAANRTASDQDWELVAQLAQWIAAAADWRIRDAQEESHR